MKKKTPLSGAMGVVCIEACFPTNPPTANRNWKFPVIFLLTENNWITGYGSHFLVAETSFHTWV